MNSHPATAGTSTGQGFVFRDRVILTGNSY